MKRIEAIIRPSRVGKVCIALENVGSYGVTVSQIASPRREGTSYLTRGRTYKADLMSRARVELIVRDGELDDIIKAIREAAFSGDSEDGSIFIYAMEDAIRIRTGECGEMAV